MRSWSSLLRGVLSSRALEKKRFTMREQMYGAKGAILAIVVHALAAVFIIISISGVEILTSIALGSNKQIFGAFPFSYIFDSSIILVTIIYTFSALLSVFKSLSKSSADEDNN